MEQLIIILESQLFEENNMKSIAKIIIYALLLFNILFPSLVGAKEEVNEEIMYRILLDRYNIGEQKKGEQIRIDDPYAFHGGDLKGLRTKLGVIQSLGYTAVSLSPIMKNKEDGYHGYWVEDFFEIDEQFGSIEELHKLTEAAKKRDIKVVLELPINYVSNTHPFVNDEEKANWLKAVDISPEDASYWLDDVVAFNQENPEVQEYLLTVIDYWMDEADIAGFDLHSVDQMSSQFLTKVIDHIKEKDESFYLFGTILEVEKTKEVIEQFGEDILIANNDLFEALTDTFKEIGNPVSTVYETWEELGGRSAYMFIDDDLTKRFSQLVVEQGRNPVTAWKLALTYMYTSPGVPVIFQGSEVLMLGDGFPESHRMVPIHSAERELEQFFYRIASVKKEFLALSKGSFEMVDSDGAMTVFKRSYEDETLFIAINNDQELRKVDVAGIEKGKRVRGIMADNISVMNEAGTYNVGIPMESVEIYLVEEDVGINWMFISFVAGVFFLFVLAVIYLSIKQKARSS